MSFEKTTEKPSLYDHLEKMSVTEILAGINKEDMKIANTLHELIPDIEAFVSKTFPKMHQGGRLFYLGAGTSGRLGIVDASECPPTFGVPHGMVVGLIAGGDSAIRKAVEFAEDDTEQAWKDLEEYELSASDTIVGIAASGTTPYVIGGLKEAQAHGLTTACITCNMGSPITEVADFPLVAVVGPEFVTGSTRMKAGTAQKLILNMISTSIMIKLGRVKGNRMIDMQLSNDKLVDRGTKMVMDTLKVSYETANQMLKEYESVRKAIEFGLNSE